MPKLEKGFPTCCLANAIMRCSELREQPRDK